MVEVEKDGFSIEPFLYVDGKLITWNDCYRDKYHYLEWEKYIIFGKSYLPIPWGYKIMVIFFLRQNYLLLEKQI